MRRDRANLLRAAADYLQLTGFQDTSMEDISQAIGVARTALYYHFGTKSNILSEILLSGAQEGLKIIEEIVSYPIPATDRLTLLVRALMKNNLTSSAANMAAGQLSPLLTPEQRSVIIAKRDGMDKLFRDLIQEAADSGEIRPLNIKMVSHAILTAVGGVQSWFRPDGPLSIEEVAAIYSDFFLRGLGGDRPAYTGAEQSFSREPAPALPSTAPATHEP